MEKTMAEKRLFSLLKHRSFLLIVAAVFLAFLLTFSLTFSSGKSSPELQSATKTKILPPWQTDPDADLEGSVGDGPSCANLRHDSHLKTFYDDPKVGYTIGKSIQNWDEKRREWFRRHPSFVAGSQRRVILVTGSQSAPCKSPIGDHLLLRLFKNKVDYCRIHGYDIFYNNAMLHPKMPSYWAKISVVRSAMVAHPEAEWVWWVDSDAVITDMDFVPPLERYKNHNLVVGGSPDLVYGKDPSWIGLNAGVFYIRNCQWSMDFMEDWAKMGPQTPDYNRWGQILTSAFKDKLFPVSDDQSAMIYLFREKKKWSEKAFLENKHCIQGYWAGLVSSLDNVTRSYVALERTVRRLRRRHAEKVGESYGALWEQYLESAGYRKDAGKRPCITHFTGCQPCSGEFNSMYTGDDCWKGMERALNFADNQVLRRYGFVHPDLLDLSSVSPLPFDYPA